jgi:integrase
MNTLTTIESYSPINGAILAWANGATDATSPRRRDLLHDKAAAVTGFFEWTGKQVESVTPGDLLEWRDTLEQRGLSQNTIYARISRVSAFYTWAMKSGLINSNPVELARPKAPKAYQTESVKALDDDQVRALLAVVKGRQDVQGRRDYAMLLFFILTGMRRAEVCGIKWQDLKINGKGFTVTVRVKGGEIVTREVDNPALRVAILDYLDTSGRKDSIRADDALWLRHDRGSNGKAVTSHGIAKAFIEYAEQAGITGFHIHQLRHTHARIVAEESGSLYEVQEQLGHKNISTTRVYVQRIGVKRDKFSSRVAARLEL